jgi:hypothetical protein
VGRQIKKKSRSFSLTDEEITAFERRAAEHGFADRNEYLLALFEADAAHKMILLLHRKERVLRALHSPQHEAAVRENYLEQKLKAAWAPNANEMVAEEKQAIFGATPGVAPSKTVREELAPQPKANAAPQNTPIAPTPRPRRPRSRPASHEKLE